MWILRSMLAFAVIIMLIGEPSYAFKQEPVTESQGATSENNEKKKENAKDEDSSLGVKDSGGQNQKNHGTEIRIPGIGTIGVLPKLDFGLELLYGANGDQKPDESKQPDQDDVTIRGSVKHRF